MANDDNAPSARMRWARLRFQILGPLLASPADDGELKTRIAELAARPWRNPTNGDSVRFSFKTIERWWYTARDAPDPLSALARKVPSHAGTHPKISPALVEAITKQHRDHPRWSFQLHHDNLLALARENPSLGVVPSYPTLGRFMKEQGLLRARKRRSRDRPDAEPFVVRETRSYEVAHVHGLWHLAGISRTSWPFVAPEHVLRRPAGGRARSLAGGGWRTDGPLSPKEPRTGAQVRSASRAVGRQGAIGGSSSERFGAGEQGRITGRVGSTGCARFARNCVTIADDSFPGQRGMQRIPTSFGPLICSPRGPRNRVRGARLWRRFATGCERPARKSGEALRFEAEPLGCE